MLSWDSSQYQPGMSTVVRAPLYARTMGRTPRRIGAPVFGQTGLFIVFSLNVTIRTGIGPERVGMGHGDDVVAAIDKMNLAGDAGREVREQVESGAAKLFECHAAMQRRMALLECEHETRIPDPGSRHRADGPPPNPI